MSAMIQAHIRALTTIVSITGIAGSSSAWAGEFRGLGFLEPASQSIAYGVSADGRTVVGESISPLGMEAFRWTKKDGMVGLGFLSNQIRSSQAMAVSAHGEIIVGVSTTPGAHLEDGAPFYWTQQSGMVRIPSMSQSDFGGIAQAVTPDGQLVVGWCASPGLYQPFFWTQDGGTQGLGVLPNEKIGRGMGVSADGSIIVGNVSFDSTTFPRAYRWTAQTGIVLLPSLNDGAISSANAITPDGRVIVGQSAGRAARWVDLGNGNFSVANLGEIQGGMQNSLYWASAVSADGAIVTGVANYNATEGTGEAFIWDQQHGIRSLKRVLLSDYGIPTTGWGLFDARGLSADGSVIVGYGFDPQGFQEAFYVNLRSRKPSPIPVGELAPPQDIAPLSPP